MNFGFIKQAMWHRDYVLAPNTSASYYSMDVEMALYFQDDRMRRKQIKQAVLQAVKNGNEHLLPYRIGILQGDSIVSVNHTGRALKPMVAQLKASFTSVEESPYKQHKPFVVQTGLWQVEGKQMYYYGTLGISNKAGKIIQDNADLIVIRTSDWKSLSVYVFRGLAGVNKQITCLPEVIAFLEESNVI